MESLHNVDTEDYEMEEIRIIWQPMIPTVYTKTDAPSIPDF